MNRDDFERFLSVIESDIAVLSWSKGMDYAGFDDILSCIKESAEDMEQSVEKTLYTYMQKHWAAIRSYCNGSYQDSEPLRGRVLDMIHFLAMLLVADEEKEGEG